MSAQDLVEALSRRGWILATAESCTGGMISAAVTDIAGSSAVFDRGFVTYSNAAKTEMLDVPMQMIERYGAVSEEVAQAMANGALRSSGGNIAISVTGIAGPGGSEHKPEGRVCFGLATQTGAHTQTVEFGAIGRANVRAQTVDHALRILISELARQDR